MCFNVVVINKRRRNIRTQVLNLLTYAQFNPHGFSIYTVRDGEEMVLRTLSFKELHSFVKESVSDNELVHMHFRFATSGSVSVENVHMWRVEHPSGYYYASHNGVVHKYTTIDYGWWLGKRRAPRAREVRESDSYMLVSSEEFRRAIFEDCGALPSVLAESGFYGVMLLTNPRRLVVIAYRKPAHVTVSNGVLYISNEYIGDEVAAKRRVYGFSFIGALHTTIENKALFYSLESMGVEREVELEVERAAYSAYSHLYYDYYHYPSRHKRSDEELVDDWEWQEELDWWLSRKSP